MSHHVVGQSRSKDLLLPRGQHLVHTAMAMASFFKHFHVPLMSQSECSNWSPWYPFLLLPLSSWMGIEPIHDGNGNDIKIMKIVPLLSQCEWVLRLVSTVTTTTTESIFFIQCHCEMGSAPNCNGNGNGKNGYHCSRLWCSYCDCKGKQNWLVLLAFSSQYEWAFIWRNGLMKKR